ncbi:MAG: Gfo/Idh/MocA family protein [Opitutales bacterium]
MKKLKVGVTGVGGFAVNFIPLLKAHPWVEEVRIAELREARRAEVASQYALQHTYANHDEMCASDVDAVLIFTERVHHFPFAKQALQAGKHVYTAVPMGNSLEEIGELVELVKTTGQVYMMGETSLYYPCLLYCRERFAKGDFGKFIYGEGEYYHDMADNMAPFYKIYQNAHGDKWRQYAGFPPMLYPTHSVAMVLGVTGARMTHVSCIGYNDTAHEDGCWGQGKNFWDNPFSSQCGLFQTSDGGMARINEFRRVGISNHNHVRLSIFGTKATFEEQVGPDEGSYAWSELEPKFEDPRALVECRPGQETGPADLYLGTAKIHPTHRLPESFRGLRNAHYGSHQFLMDDFVKACVHGKTPPNNVWDASRFNAPGLVAHESCLKDGERLPVPDFGMAPTDSLLDVNEQAT